MNDSAAFISIYNYLFHLVACSKRFITANMKSAESTQRTMNTAQTSHYGSEPHK